MTRFACVLALLCCSACGGQDEHGFVPDHVPDAVDEPDADHVDRDADAAIATSEPDAQPTVPDSGVVVTPEAAPPAEASIDAVAHEDAEPVSVLDAQLSDVAADSGADTDADAAPAEPCECTAGVCCDGCHFRKTNYRCAVDQEYASACEGGYNSYLRYDVYAVARYYQSVFCPGDSGGCTGHTFPTYNTREICGRTPDTCIDPDPGTDSAYCAAP